jgi:hypothetical protein
MNWKKLDWQKLPIDDVQARNICVRLRSSLFITHCFTPHKFFLDTAGNIFATELGGQIREVNEYLLMDPKESVE